MSKKSNQTLTMLIMICAIMQSMRQCRSFAKVELQKAIDDIFETAGNAFRKWPIVSSIKWVEAKRKECVLMLDTLDKENYPSVELIKMADRLLSDLEYENRYGTRRELLSKIRPGLDKLVQHSDREGRNFPAWEEADGVINLLYGVIGMENV